MLAGLGIHDLPLFLAAALLLNLTPGPDMLFVAGASAAHGRAAGVRAALGVGAGTLLHVALAAAGLAALLAALPLAFTLLQWAGAAYLVWIGVQLLRRPPGLGGAPRVADARVFWQGALTNALNPKVAMFFLAFLPQFVAADAPAQALGFVVLGMLFNAGGTVVNVLVALLAGSLHGGGRVARWLPRVAGGLFVALGLRLAFAPR